MAVVAVAAVGVAVVAAEEEVEVKDVDISYVALWARGHNQHERKQERGTRNKGGKQDYAMPLYGS